MMKEIRGEDFAEKIGQGSGVVLVDFWAARCGPCILLKPHLEELAAHYTGATFYKVDVDQEVELASQFSIRSIPTVIILVDGQLKERVVGVQPATTYKELLDTYVQTKKSVASDQAQTPVTTE